MTWNCFHGRRTGQHCMKGKPIWSQQAHQFLWRLPEVDGKGSDKAGASNKALAGSEGAGKAIFKIMSIFIIIILICRGRMLLD